MYADLFYFIYKGAGVAKFPYIWISKGSSSQPASRAASQPASRAAEQLSSRAAEQLRD
jgi:hypothetical protein